MDVFDRPGVERRWIGEVRADRRVHVREFTLTGQDTVKSKGRQLIHVTYHLPAPPDPVTGMVFDLRELKEIMNAEVVDAMERLDVEMARAELD